MQRSSRSATATQVALNTRSKRQLPDSTPARSHNTKRNRSATGARASKHDKLVESPALPLTVLPFDAVSTILSFLTATDLLKCMRVNRWCKQQIYTPSAVSLANTIFQWSPTRKRNHRLTMPPKPPVHGKRLPITLPHLRRLHVQLPEDMGADDTLLESCQLSVNFIWHEVHAHCHSLVEFKIGSPERVEPPSDVHDQLSSLQTLSISYIVVGPQQIATLGDLYPNLTSLSLDHQPENTDLDNYCQSISQSFPHLVTLQLPNLEGSAFWLNSDIAELAPLTRLRQLEVYAFGDTIFTLPVSWQLESLNVVKNKPINTQSPLVVQGQITSLQSLAVAVTHDTRAIADALLQSMVTSGVPTALQHLTWSSSKLTQTTAVANFALFRQLKTLSLPTKMNIQLLCAILRHLDCTLQHLHLPRFSKVANIEACYQTLTESAAVQHCRSINLPYALRVSNSAWRRLITNLPRLHQVWLAVPSKVEDEVKNRLARVAARIVKRNVDVRWSTGSAM